MPIVSVIVEDYFWKVFFVIIGILSMLFVGGSITIKNARRSTSKPLFWLSGISLVFSSLCLAAIASWGIKLFIGFTYLFEI